MYPEIISRRFLFLMPKYNISINKSIKELKIEEEYLNDDIEQINVSIESQDKRYVIDIIRKFTNTKKIEEYVDFKYYTR